MSDDSIVGPKCREVENLLVSHYGATGQGLGKLAASVKDRLPITLIKAIWRVAGMRNAVVHRGEMLRNRPRFLELCDDVISDLERFNYTSRASTEAPAPASAEFRSIWFEFDAVENGIYGLRIHADLSIYGLVEESCQIAAFFVHDDGTHLKNDTVGYSTSDGNLTANIIVTPPYLDTQYSDTVLFVPNSELRAPSGVHNISAYVAVCSLADSKWFASSERVPFTLTIP